MRDFFAALQFLTILPVSPVRPRGANGVKIGPDIEGKAFGRSLAWFPFVGLMIGLTISLPVLLSDILPQAVIAALIVAASIVITGGIHLDGFADTCDGLYGSSSRERALEIMRDSRIGTMATVGVAMLLILKFSILASMPREIIVKSLILMAAFARWSQVLACVVSKYARGEGKAKHFIEYASKRELLVSSLFILTLFIFLLGVKGIALFALSALPAFVMINYIKIRIGGMTGDTIGAVSEASEAAVLLFCLGLGRFGL